MRIKCYKLRLYYKSRGTIGLPVLCAIIAIYPEAESHFEPSAAEYRIARTQLEWLVAPAYFIYSCGGTGVVER